MNIKLYQSGGFVGDKIKLFDGNSDKLSKKILDKIASLVPQNKADEKEAGADNDLNYELHVDSDALHLKLKYTANNMNDDLKEIHQAILKL
ncbi:MAG: hypothetical protein U0U67_11900 [Chitinophagales bacterium]